MVNKARAAIVALAVAAACGSAPSADPASLVLGSDPRAFEPLAAGGTIKAYKGPQEGFHVFLTARTTGLLPGSLSEAPTPCGPDAPPPAGTPRNPCVDFVVSDLTVGRVLDVYVPLRLPLTLGPSAGVYDVIPPRLVQMDIHGLDEVDGHQFLVSASIVDAAGARASAELQVTCEAQRPVEDAGPLDGGGGDAAAALE